MPEVELVPESEGFTEEEKALLSEYQADGELPQEEPETEPQALAPEPETPAPEPVKVPLDELKDERRKRQAAEEKLNTAIERMNYLMSQIEQVSAPEPEQPPDREEDPVAYLQWQNEQIRQRLDAQDQTRQQYTQQAQEQQAAAQFKQHYDGVIQEFASRTPDFKEAADFLQQSRRNELAMMGVTDPEMQNQVMWQDSFNIAAQALQRGMNHAEIFYNLAKSRGYHPSSSPPQTSNPSSAPAPRPSLDNVRRGQAAATSLSNVGGQGGDYELTAEALVNMTEEEFAAATTGKKWRRLHGG